MKKGLRYITIEKKDGLWRSDTRLLSSGRSIAHGCYDTLHETRKDYGRTPERHTHIPAIARHVFDVTGAGDTVVAIVAAAVAAGASYLEAARLAAIAAGYVVGEVGTTVCPLEKLKELANAD